MKAELEAKMQYGIGGLVCGAVVAIIIGFSWGGWSTASATQKVTDTAIRTSQAAICVAQYTKEPKTAERMKEFAAIDSYKRSEFIEKGGWDKMPGQKDAGFGVASDCAEGLEGLIKK